MSGVNLRKCCCGGGGGVADCDTCTDTTPASLTLDISFSAAPAGLYINVGGGFLIDWDPSAISGTIHLAQHPTVPCLYVQGCIPCGTFRDGGYDWPIYMAVWAFVNGSAVGLTINILGTSEAPLVSDPHGVLLGNPEASFTRTGTLCAPLTLASAVIDSRNYLASPCSLSGSVLTIDGDPQVMFDLTSATITASTDVVEIADCGGVDPTRTPADCTWDCSSCALAYKGTLNVTSTARGNTSFDFCCAFVAGISELPGRISCVYSDTRDTANLTSIFTDLDADGNCQCFLVHHDSVYGTVTFKQTFTGTCPTSLWTFVSADFSGDTATVTGFVAADDCSTCTATTHSTGATSTGTPAVDSYWTVDIGGSAYVIDPKDSAWATPPTGSKWISHASDKASSGTTHSYVTTINIPADGNTDALVIPFDAACDNAITDLLINGHSTGIEVTGFASTTARELTPGFWITGDNSIEFQTADSGGVEGLLVAWGTPNCDPLTTCEQGIVCPKTYTVRVYFDPDTLLTGTASRTDTSRTWTGSVTGTDYEGPIRITCINEVPDVSTQSYHIEIGPVGAPVLVWDGDATWTGTAWDCPSGTDFAQAGTNDVYPDDPYIELA